jgi:hypothetical protein
MLSVCLRTKADRAYDSVSERHFRFGAAALFPFGCVLFSFQKTGLGRALSPRQAALVADQAKT